MNKLFVVLMAASLFTWLYDRSVLWFTLTLIALAGLVLWEVFMVAKRISPERMRQLAALAERGEKSQRINAPQLLGVLDENVIGQTIAKKTLADKLAIRSAYPEEKRSRPMGVFFFVGSTGLGKTYLAEKLAEAIERPTFKVNCGSVAHHYLSTLVGSPVGYQGGEDQGALIQHLEGTGGYTVIILDEIEKVIDNPQSDFAQFCLALFERGVVVPGNAKGGQENSLARNAVIIATSNAEQESVSELAEFADSPDLENRIRGIMKNCFAPEFIGRVDAFVPFFPYSEDEMAAIVEVEIEKMVGKLDMELDPEITGIHDQFWMETYLAWKSSNDGLRVLPAWLERNLGDELVKAFDAGYHRVRINHDGEGYQVEMVTMKEDMHATAPST